MSRVQLDRRPAILLDPREEPGDDHLVRLLVELDQLDRPDLVVPPLHVGGVEELQQQRLPDHPRGLPTQPAPYSFGTRMISILRFFAFPSAVSLVATGFHSP